MHTFYTSDVSVLYQLGHKHWPNHVNSSFATSALITAATQAIGYGGSLTGRQENTDTADTLQLRDVAKATIFWLSMGHNFGCMIASDTMFDSWGWVFGVKLSHEDTAKIEVLMDVAIATVFWVSTYGCTLAPSGEYN